MSTASVTIRGTVTQPLPLHVAGLCIECGQRPFVVASDMEDDDVPVAIGDIAVP